jgi:energy-converting hydrogenase A subunit M
MKIPFKTVLDPDNDNLQAWADEPQNSCLIHDASVEAARMMCLDKKLDSVMIIKFAWEDEVYADLSLTRKDAPEAVELAINYYVNCEEYEAAAYAKKWADTIKVLDK